MIKPNELDDLAKIWWDSRAPEAFQVLWEASYRFLIVATGFGHDHCASGNRIGSTTDLPAIVTLEIFAGLKILKWGGPHIQRFSNFLRCRYEWRRKKMFKPAPVIGPLGGKPEQIDTELLAQEERQYCAAVLRAVRRLGTPTDCKVFFAVHFRGKSFEEVGARFGQPAGTLKSRMNRLSHSVATSLGTTRRRRGKSARRVP